MNVTAVRWQRTQIASLVGENRPPRKSRGVQIDHVGEKAGRLRIVCCKPALKERIGAESQPTPHVIKLPRGRHATCAQVSPFPATNSELADNVLTTCDGEGPVAENRPSAERVEVLIIGAGMAGMTAAHILATANVSFAVLEAQNYTGGRIHAMQFGHSDGTLCVSRLRPID